MTKENYEYPLDIEWTTNEMVIVMHLFQAVEKVYEKGFERDKFLEYYTAFKRVVPSKGEEKRLDKKFFEVSGYSIYAVVKNAKDNNQAIIHI